MRLATEVASRTKGNLAYFYKALNKIREAKDINLTPEAEEQFGSAEDSIDIEIMKKFFVFIFFLFSNNLLANTIEYVEVKAKGNGSTYSEALNNALSNAIAQVNGRSIETQSSLKKYLKQLM